MGSKVYAIVCAGMGDTQVTVVSKSTMDWVMSTDNGKRDQEGFAWDDMAIPDDVLEAWKASERGLDAAEDGEDRPRLTSGSWQNDRAITAPPLEGYETYWSVAEAMEAISGNGDQLGGTYEGALY